jgi:hypothetical protein
MNSFVMLLVAASATAADPQPVVQQPATSTPIYTYTESAPESRPGLMGRIRGTLGLKSSPGDQVSPGTAPTVRYYPGGSSPEPPLADATPVEAPAPRVTPTPAPAPQQVIVSPPAYTYQAPTSAVPAQPSRPRHFSRIRKLFGSSASQPSAALPADYFPTAPVQRP